ncbi:Uroporphyrinogen III synthase HEM4 [Rhizobium sp. PDO1-076]|uniref:uroporphyrinogen-III synthase n=1 Tax=Rhizobium sp. PDO1-076 TaxID=1125979 RepID=UPI00024E3633|nr:uroporphyrinogen-III synthase [Rhizobium sp. PDO1-076]EHS50150.1 Uroporphyrinogen III synthase HEM4 [Rhizobium sp. PDO1-076]
MRVLVTRPEPSAEKTAAQLRRRGHQPVLLSLMQAQRQLGTLRQALAEAPRALAVTSGEAVRVLASLGQDLSPLLALPVFAVGIRTAEAAKNLGFTNVLVGGGDGEALADRILAEWDNGRDNSLLYLAGTPRTPGLETRLTEAGLKLAVAECYRMLPVNHDLTRLQAAFDPWPDVALLYSAETARHFVSLPPMNDDKGHIKNLRILCLSNKIAETLPPELRASAAWPSEPNEDLLLDLI